ncbi:MAG: substrate-binding domain-containing protein, partial [Planctomycetales bacterium]|nr:substrate-binding domain-containing protein [Planctomycetales bacterium]
MSRSWLWLLLGAFLFVVPLSGCGGGGSGDGGSGSGSESKRILLLTNGDDPFWDCMREGMIKASEDLKLADAGMVAELDKNDGTPKGQVDKLKQYASRSDVAAVMISVIEPNNIAIYKAMKELEAQGIKVITIDSDIATAKADARTVYIGTDNMAAGRELGKAAKALAGEGEHAYAAFSGYPDTDNASKRVAGFGEAAGESFKLTENLGDELNHSTAQRNVRTALDNHQEIDVLCGIWAYNAHAIVEVVKERD